MRLTLFTELSSVTGQADAGEGVDPIQTGGSIQAWIGLALVDICRDDGVRRGQQDTLTLFPHVCLSVWGQLWCWGEECGLVRLSVCGPVSQCCPVYPGAHMHMLCPPLSEQDPPFLHVPVEQGRTSAQNT